ncbi:hybrid sensor histidine kinase/response regulator transcription factor [Thalassobellus citreus]|uniref:hybrid sensor histidine kinase/response regulator transcription factor n=1 Tax=Thalassobellus citreus TaxID=3367752 RepID=UPI0037A06FB5
MKKKFIIEKNYPHVIFILLALFFFKVSVSQNNKSIQFTHFTTEDGLPSSYVKSIIQDHEGYIWAATRNAVVRFDGITFREFPAYDRNNKLVNFFSNKLLITNDSILLARANNEKYFYYDNNKEAFFEYTLLTNLGPTNNIYNVEDGFWVRQNDQIFFLNKKTNKRESLRQKTKLFQLKKDTKYTNLYIKNNWLTFSNNNEAIIYCYNIIEKKLIKYNLPQKLNTNQFDFRFIDSQNNLWVSSYDHGIASLNLDNNTSSFFSKKNKKLPHDFIHCITEDKYGRIWIGTENGLAIYSLKDALIDIHNFKLSNPNGLNSNPIYSSFCDVNGNVWLGTYFGGINLWDGEQTFFKSWKSGYGKWQITGSVVSSLTEDFEKNLWVGMEDNGINKINTLTGEITSYNSKDSKVKLSYNNIHDLLFVSKHELWVATYTGGINIINTKTNKIKYYNRENTNNQLSNSIFKFYLLKNTIYIATNSGIVSYNLKEKKFKKLKPEIIGSKQFQSITYSNNKLWFATTSQAYSYDLENDILKPFDLIPEIKNITFVKSDSKDQLWIGDCYKGLTCYNTKNKTIQQFNTDNRFPANWIFSIEEGINDWYWASTDKGLVKFSVKKNKYILFDNNSGIPFNQFNFRASFKDSHDFTYFGGNNGMISFNEKLKPLPIKNHPIAFTSFQLFNKQQSPLNSETLKESINQIDTLELKYNQNIFTIEFSAFNYNSNGRCKYLYYLEGLETPWNNKSNNNFATYTNLSPGTYTFKVKAFLNTNQEDAKERQLIIIISPPFWLTNWAYFIYFLLVLIAIIIVFKIGKKIEKSKTLVELERREKTHANEINKVKLEFFTNISHELKTPLTLILGPLKKIIDEEKLSPKLKKQLLGIDRNANRLLQLIKELLEFRKIDTGSEKLKVSSCNVLEYMEDISISFDALAKNKNIKYKQTFTKPNKQAYFDINKVDKIVLNLLSNAFNHTPRDGKVSFSVSLKKRNQLNSKTDLIIKVSNSGKGIKPEMLDKVFDRFFQVENKNNYNHLSSGIGLAYVKSIVDLHKGSINIESIENKKTTFTVILPASIDDYTQDEIVEDASQNNKMNSDNLNILKHTISEGNKLVNNLDLFSSKPLILIVEDNIELIVFMKEILSTNYKIVTAENGKVALEKLKSISPELIISDVMMPEMDGIEFSTKIKKNIEFSHIPIVLLTSKTSPESKLEGFQSGADYYVEKPFYPKILKQNIENILNTRKHIIEKFRSDEFINTEDIGHSESDKIFIKNLTTLIKDNINNKNLDVTFITKEMSVSRSLLHIKLKKLTGCSSTEFIKAIRLKEAVKLISKGKHNYSQAAYETGFSSPTYFSRSFREFYGKSPKEYFNN